MATKWKDEFKCHSFGLSHRHPQDFYVSRWQRSQSVHRWYVCYRMLLAFWSFGVVVSSFVEGRYKVTEFLLDTNQGFLKFWPIYLTNWGFLCLTAQLILSAVVIMEKLSEKVDNSPAKSTLLQRISWLLYSVSTTTGFFISIIFWTQIYSPERPLSAQSILTHAVNSLVILVDIFISARPCRLVHFYQPLLLLMSFVLFSLVHWVSGGTNEHGKPYIYAAFDWSHIRISWLRMALALISILPVHAVVWLLHLFRDFLFRRCCASFIDADYIDTPTSIATKH